VARQTATTACRQRQTNAGNGAETKPI